MKLTYDKIVTYLFLIIIAITTVWDIVCRDGVKLPRIALILVTLLIFDFIFKRSFLRKSKMTYVAIIIFIFFSMYLANDF